MATEKVILLDTAKAAADLSSKQYCVVKFDGSGNLVLAGAGDVGFVLQDNPTSGHYGSFGIVGISKIVLGGTVAAGGPISSDASGHGVAATIVSGAFTTALVGIALKAGVSGDVAEMLIAVQPV